MSGPQFDAKSGLSEYQDYAEQPVDSHGLNVWAETLYDTLTLDGDGNTATMQQDLPELMEINGSEEEAVAPVLPSGAEAPPVAPIVVDEPIIPVAEKIYLVVPGDTLGKIARQHKTTVSVLKKKNGLKNDILRIGQKLKLP
jgi:LysM repeat protein